MCRTIVWSMVLGMNRGCSREKIGGVGVWNGGCESAAWSAVMGCGCIGPGTAFDAIEVDCQRNPVRQAIAWSMVLGMNRECSREKIGGVGGRSCDGPA